MALSSKALLANLTQHVRECGPVVITWTGTVFATSSEWGQEADDSPMVGAAAYGMADTLHEALEELLSHY